MLETSKIFILFPLVLALVACGTDSGSGDKDATLDETDGATTPVTITSSGSSGKQSNISLRLTDAPVDDLVRAVVNFTAIKLRRRSGGWIMFTLNTPKAIDLMKLQGGDTDDLLMNVTADADDYDELRLFTSSSGNFVELASGGIETLDIPGGSGAGLKLKQYFTITENKLGNFVVDIDLRQSIRSPGNSGKYQLKPVMRLVTANGAGNIQGTVDSSSLLAPGCSDGQVDTFNAAYIFPGHNAVPGDINQQSGTGPLATAAIDYEPGTDSYRFNAAFLLAGDYTVAVTCNADQEDLDADDNLRFFDIQNTTVLANDTVFL